ncbi:MAG: hypothetical protein Kow0069_11240 [Promethearchaeota archaeon]
MNVSDERHVKNMPCGFCGEPKTSFECELCGQRFCDAHVLSTEIYECKKCGLKFRQEDAKKVKFRCPNVPKSQCPICHSELRLNRLPAGQFYLGCTNELCGWDSITNPPIVLSGTTNLALREGFRRGWVRKPKTCGQPLKRKSGERLCPNCFVNFVATSGTVNFATIAARFGIEDEKAVGALLKGLLEDDRLYGVLDEERHVFVAVSKEMRRSMLNSITETGRVDLTKYADHLGLSVDKVKALTLDVVKSQRLEGEFALDDSSFYTTQYVRNEVVRIVTGVGRITLKDLAAKFKLEPSKIKGVCVELMRNKALTAYFADQGNEVVTREKLEAEVKAFAEAEGVFKLEDAANHFRVALELVRRSIHHLVETGKLRGIFTQKREYITENTLREKIQGYARAYREILLSELARRLGITERTVEEMLAALIANGTINGYIDAKKRVFVLEKDAHLVVPTGAGVPSAGTAEEEGKVEVVRGYDFIGGQLHFKVAVRNFTPMTIHQVKVVLDVPGSFHIAQEVITIPTIEPGTSRGVDFYLEPESCGISRIGGTVIYKDARGRSHPLTIKPLEVQIKCPLVVKTLDSIEDCQLAIQDLPSDARAFLIADLDPRLAYRAAMRAILNFDTRLVTSHETEEAGFYKAEAWFSSKAKVTGGRIITRIYLSGVDQSLEIRVWCNNPGQLTGFLAKAIEILFAEINIIRKVRAESRERTIDLMALTQNILLVSNYAELKWNASDILVKLQDIQGRLVRLISPDDPVVVELSKWIDALAKYDGEQPISDEDAENLAKDMEVLKDFIERTVTPAL